MKTQRLMKQDRFKKAQITAKRTGQRSSGEAIRRRRKLERDRHHRTHAD